MRPPSAPKSEKSPLLRFLMKNRKGRKMLIFRFLGVNGPKRPMEMLNILYVSARGQKGLHFPHISAISPPFQEKRRNTVKCDLWGKWVPGALRTLWNPLGFQGIPARGPVPSGNAEFHFSHEFHGIARKSVKFQEIPEFCISLRF